MFLVKKYKGYYKQNVNFRLLTKGYKEYKGVKYPYMNIHGYRNEAFSLEFWKNKREYIGDDIKL